MYRHIPLVALSLLSSLFLAACGNGTPPPAAARPAIVVQPQPAGEVSQAFPGEIRARHEPELAFRIGGKVIRRLVEVGERVKKDQPLAELDPQDVRLQLEAARAQVSAAEANLQTVRAEYRRYRTLLDRNLVSHSQFENIQNSYRAGEARLKQIRAEFNVADNQAGYAVLRSPQDGVIASRRVEVGQVVAASRTFAARVAFDDRATPAELGQSARVYVAAAEAVPLSVPLSALTAEAGQAFVWVVEPGSSTLRRQAVRTGPYAEDRVPVLEGLKAGDWVVATGVQVLREGQQVRPIDRANRTVKLAAKE